MIKLDFWPWTPDEKWFPRTCIIWRLKLQFDARRALPMWNKLTATNAALPRSESPLTWPSAATADHESYKRSEHPMCGRVQPKGPQISDTPFFRVWISKIIQGPLNKQPVMDNDYEQTTLFNRSNTKFPRFSDSPIVQPWKTRIFWQQKQSRFQDALLPIWWYWWKQYTVKEMLN